MAKVLFKKPGFLPTVETRFFPNRRNPVFPQPSKPGFFPTVETRFFANRVSGPTETRFFANRVSGPTETRFFANRVSRLKTDILSTPRPKKPGFCKKPGFWWGH
jgi:hypothetical protein